MIAGDMRQIIQSYNDKDSTYCFQAAMCQMMNQALSVLWTLLPDPAPVELYFIKFMDRGKVRNMQMEG